LSRLCLAFGLLRRQTPFFFRFDGHTLILDRNTDIVFFDAWYIRLTCSSSDLRRNAELCEPSGLIKFMTDS
jgi:hypothetical protein